MSDQTPITGSFIWTLEDVKASQDVLIKTRSRQQNFVTITLALVAIICMIYYRTSIHSLFDLLLYAFPLFIIFFIPFSVRYNQKSNLERAFSQRPDSNKRIDITFTQDEIIMKAEGIYENKWKWNTIKEVQRNPKGFCFFLAEQTGFWVPIRAFASQADIDSMVQLARQLSREKPSLKYTELI